MHNVSRRPLGALERAVMDFAWSRETLTVHDACEALADRALAYNTVMTTLDRLFKKGLLAREKAGHAYAYRARLGRDAYERLLVAAVLEDLPTASRDAVLCGFLDFVTTDDATLDALERLIAERKRGRP